MITVIKSQPAPECLAIEKSKSNGSYVCGDVLTRNAADFHGKCYICEFKWPTNLNTEHFKPHKDANNDLKFDWNNLFLACSHCNNLKSDKFEDILNCTDSSHSVETAIRYHINPYPMELAEIAALTDNDRTNNTVELILLAFNGSTPLKKLEAAHLRSQLLAEIRRFQSLLFAFIENAEGENKEWYRRQIIDELSVASSFTSFKRWVIIDCKGLSEFLPYCKRP